MYLLSLLLVLVIYIISDFLLRKKLKTKIHKGFKRRNKFFLTLHIVLIGGLFFTIILTPYGYYSLALFVSFFLITILDGLEEWLFKRQNKEYYHSWLGAFFFLVASIIIMMR